MVRDDLLLQSIPKDIKVHHVPALDKRWTSKIGLGSIALRSIIFYYAAVNKLLKTNKYDLIYFSTTQFPILALAATWKKRFGIKIVFDIQDPWYTSYYKFKPKHERPKKFWFSYYLNKMLEPLAMQASDGLISVSAGYVEVLQKRYPHLSSKPHLSIPFGIHLPDLTIAYANPGVQPLLCVRKTSDRNTALHNQAPCFNLVYIGRGGHDLLPAFRALLDAVRLGLKLFPQEFRRVKVHLFGTSYAPNGEGKKTFLSDKELHGVEDIFQESTDRLPFYRTLNTLKAADMLFMPGPDQAEYVASKLFPYLMVERPILAIVHPCSKTSSLLRTIPQARVFHFGQANALMASNIAIYLRQAILGLKHIPVEKRQLKHYSSEHLTRLQTNLFNQVCQTPD